MTSKLTMVFKSKCIFYFSGKFGGLFLKVQLNDAFQHFPPSHPRVQLLFLLEKFLLKAYFTFVSIYFLRKEENSSQSVILFFFKQKCFGGHYNNDLTQYMQLDNILLGNYACSWDFPGGPVVGTLSFHCRGSWIQFLLRELRITWHGQEEKSYKKNL